MTASTLHSMPSARLGGGPNGPFTFKLLPPWPIAGWSLKDVVDIIGSDTEIQFQNNRLDDPLYEMNSHNHRAIDKFGRFVTRLTTGEPNDVYLTAQNGDHGPTRDALRPLLSLCRPLPNWLRDDPCSGFVWLGRGTMTPLHYDQSDNTMCQVLGQKHIRLFAPDQTDRLDHIPGTVHSTLGWVTDRMIMDRDLAVHDVYLSPGVGVFVPPGWWHCVSAPDVSLTMVFTCSA